MDIKIKTKEMDAEQINEMEEMMNQMKEQRKHQFGVEAGLRGLLWDAQVDEDQFNNTMSQLIRFMRELVTNEDMQTDLFEIDLSQYEDDEDEYLED